MNRRESLAEEVRTIGIRDLEIDLDSREVRIGDFPVKLTAREYQLLVFLVSNPGRWYLREELLAAVWGFTYGDAATVTVHVGRLREKFKPISDHRYIRTVRNRGYGVDP